MTQLFKYIVNNSGGKEQLVFVSQDIKTDKNKVIISARKFFTLDSENGEEVFRGDDQRSFVKRNGQVLKIVMKG